MPTRLIITRAEQKPLIKPAKSSIVKIRGDLTPYDPADVVYLIDPRSGS